jgi:hypothetical protein
MTGTHKLPLWPADLMRNWGSCSPAGQQLTFSLTGRILVCPTVAVKNPRHAASLAISTSDLIEVCDSAVVRYRLEKPLEVAFCGVGSL